MKKIVLLISLVVLLSSCWNKEEAVLIEPTTDIGVIEEEVTQNKNVTVSGGTDETPSVEEDTTNREEATEAVKKEKIPAEAKVVEEKKVETKTPVVKTQTVKDHEETTPTKTVDHEPSTPVVDEGTDELIDDMIGDIDDIFKEIESEG